MTKVKHTDNNTGDDFVLKHRIVGAAFLLFFGALVLPRLLGPPSEASNAQVSVNNVAEEAEVDSPAALDDILNLPESDDEEQVYISKITPLDAAPSGETKPAKIESKPADVERVADSEEEKAEAAKVEEPSIKSKPVDTPSGVDEEAQKKLSAALAAESAPKSQNNKVDQGWVVQVGLYEKKRGADKVMQHLKSKGFSPSVTIVDTNQGKAAGMRVWLGPYQRRVDAAKAQARLIERTGESGFLRVYP